MFTLLRLVHILTGVFWAGTVFFMVSFLLPAFAKLGPAAGPVQAEFANRGLFQKLPAIGLVTVLSGFWMYYIRLQGTANWAPTNEARALGLGGVAAAVALIYGFTYVRPRQNRVMAIAAQLPAMAAGAEKDALMAEAGVLRGKVAMSARLVATLLGVTVISMAIARYV